MRGFGALVCLLCACSMLSQVGGRQYNSWSLTFTANGGCADVGTGCPVTGGNPYSSNSNNYNGGNVHHFADPAQWPAESPWSSVPDVLQTHIQINRPLSSRPTPTASLPVQAPQYLHATELNSGHVPPAATYYSGSDNSWSPYQRQPGPRDYYSVLPEPIYSDQQRNGDHADAQTSWNTHSPGTTSRSEGTGDGVFNTDGTRSRNTGGPNPGSMGEHLDRRKIQHMVKQVQLDPTLSPGVGHDVHPHQEQTARVTEPWWWGQLPTQQGLVGPLTGLDVFGPWETERRPQRPAEKYPLVTNRVVQDHSHSRGQRQQYETSPSFSPAVPTLKQDPKHVHLHLHTSWTSPPAASSQPPTEGDTPDLLKQSKLQTSSQAPPDNTANRNMSLSPKLGSNLIDTLYQTPDVLPAEGLQSKRKVKADQYDVRSSQNDLDHSRKSWNEKIPQKKLVASGGIPSSAFGRQLKDKEKRGFVEKISVKNAVVLTLPQNQDRQNTMVEPRIQNQYLTQPFDSAVHSSSGNFIDPKLTNTNLSLSQQTDPVAWRGISQLASGTTGKHENPSSAQKSFAVSDDSPEKSGNTYTSSWHKFLRQGSKDKPGKEISEYSTSDESSTLFPKPESQGEVQTDIRRPSHNLQDHQPGSSLSHDSSPDSPDSQQTDHVFGKPQQSADRGSESQSAVDRQITELLQHPHQGPGGGSHTVAHTEGADRSGRNASQNSRQPEAKKTSQLTSCAHLTPTKMCSVSFPACGGYVCDAQRFCLTVETNLTAFTHPGDQQYFRDAFTCVMSGLLERRCSTCGEVTAALDVLLMDRDPAYNCLLQELRLCDVLTDPRNQFLVLSLLVPFHSTSSFRNDLARTVHKATKYCPNPDNIQVFRTLLVRSKDLEDYLHLL